VCAIPPFSFSISVLLFFAKEETRQKGIEEREIFYYVMCYPLLHIVEYELMQGKISLDLLVPIDEVVRVMLCQA
jgi:hypothetical protein